MNNYDYPPGVDNDSAPWNKDSTEVEIEVYVSVCLSKPMIIRIEHDYDEDQMNRAVEESPEYKAITENGWYIDNLVITREEEL